MGIAYGNQGHVGLSFQSSWGTANQTSLDFIPFISETFQQKIPELVSEGMRSRYEQGPGFTGFNEVGGDVVCEVHPVMIGKLLKAWCGTVNSSTLVDSVYQHTFIPLQSDFDEFAPVPPMSAEVYRGTGSGTLYSNLCLNALNIEMAHGAVVKSTATFIGGKAAKLSKSTPSFLVGSEYTWNQASVSLAGTGISTVKNLTISPNNSFKAYGTLDGTLFPNRIVRDGFRTIEISGTMILDGDAQKDIYIAGTTQNLKITLTGQTVSSGYNAQLIMEFPSFKYTEYPDNISGPGLIEISFKGRADYNVGSAHMVKFTAQNTVATY
jgi:hypothetical protein